MYTYLVLTVRALCLHVTQNTHHSIEPGGHFERVVDAGDGSAALPPTLGGAYDDVSSKGTGQGYTSVVAGVSRRNQLRPTLPVLLSKYKYTCDGSVGNARDGA